MTTRIARRTRASLSLACASSLVILASLIAAAACGSAGCGSVADTTTCRFDDTCGDAAPATSATDSGTTDVATDTGAPPPDGGCTPGEIKQIDCKKCVCDPSGVLQCVGSGCADAGPPPSTCPKEPPHGETCIGSAHCIYDSPCRHGCDCVSGAWTCVSC